MASLLALMNRAITYFKEPKSVTNSEVTTDEETNSGSSIDGISTDEETNSLDCGMITDDNVDTPMYLCIMCEYTVPIEEYNTECQRCNYCILLTEEGEKQCVECKVFKHFKQYEYLSDDRCKQCENAWCKVKMYCESCKAPYTGVA
jgi:hypothetical protein